MVDPRDGAGRGKATGPRLRLNQSARGKIGGRGRMLTAVLPA